MDNNVTFQINIAGNVLVGVGQLQGDFQQLVSVVGQVDNSVNQTFSNIRDNVGSIKLSAVIEQIKNVSEGIAGISTPGIGFEQGMADLSSITGTVGDDLEELSKAARRMGYQSGLGAAEASKAFTILASQIEVDDIGLDGLKELQQNSITLSHAAGISMEEAANALAGTINQYGLEAGEAARVINVLAAGSKYGAAEINDLAQSFKVVGAQASIAGLSVEDTAGALEILSKNNIKGAEAGTNLRNIILAMQTTLGIDFSKTSLSKALDALKPKLNDAAFMSQTFGRMSMASAQFLVQNAEAVAEMTDKVTGTDTAMEQAAIRTDTVQQMMARCRAWVDNLKIGFFDLTGSFGGYATIIAEQAVTIAQLVPLFNGLTAAIKFVTSAQKMQALWAGIVSGASAVWTGVQWALNAALWANPITWVVAAIVALIAIIVICVTKVQGWGKQWDSVVKFMKLSFQTYIETIKLGWNTMINGIMIGLDNIKLAWYKFKEAVGMGDSAKNQEMIAQISADVERRKQEIVDGAKKVRDLAVEAKNSLTWELSWKKGEGEADPADALGFGNKPVGVEVVPEISGLTGDGLDLDGLLGGGTGKGKKSGSGTTASSTLDLNKIVPNLKGSTAYSAIAERLAPVIIQNDSDPIVPPPIVNATPIVELPKPEKSNPIQSVLQAAASVALPLALPATMAATTLPQDREPMPRDYTQTEYQAENSQRTVTMERFCDKIEIHIASADGKGMEEIDRQIRRTLEDLLDDYADA